RPMKKEKLKAELCIGPRNVRGVPAILAMIRGLSDYERDYENLEGRPESVGVGNFQGNGQAKSSYLRLWWGLSRKTIRKMVSCCFRADFQKPSFKYNSLWTDRAHPQAASDSSRWGLSRHPERFVRQAPGPCTVPTEVWSNKPPSANCSV